MPKRQADKELNHDNWEEEDDKEEEDNSPGHFKQAGKEELKHRVVKLARRSLPGSPATSSPFASFAFGGSKVGSTGGTPSNFLANGLASASKMDTGPKDTNDPVFLGKLKSLNGCFLKWVKQHLEENPYCDFRPVCKDYKRHIRALEAAQTTGSIQVPSLGSAATPTTPKGNLPESKNPGTPSACTFIFAPSNPQVRQAMAPSVATSKTGGTLGGFLGGAMSSGKPAMTPASFSFVLGKPQSASAAPATVPAPEASANADAEDENYTPPKNEFTAVEEKDAVYAKRCKLFHKKGDNYVERGVGMLYIKPLGNAKHQLLLRADTSLGNILLNIQLGPSLPVSRLGKNNVVLMCVPNPPLEHEEPGPATLLLRVRTSEDADELRDALDRHKASAKS